MMFVVEKAPAPELAEGDMARAVERAARPETQAPVLDSTTPTPSSVRNSANVIGLQALAGNAAVGAPTPDAGGGATVGAAGAAGAEAGGAGGADPAGAAPGAAPAGAAPAAAPAPSPVPAPAASWTSLSTYGNLRTMTQTKIVAGTLTEIQQIFVNCCNRNHSLVPGQTQPNPPKVWTMDNAKTVGGFYDSVTSTIYVNNDLPILGYVHQLLHRNTAPKFSAMVAVPNATGIYGPLVEGATDRFAVAACKAANVAHPGPPGYVWEMGVIDKILSPPSHPRYRPVRGPDDGDIGLGTKWE